VPAEPSRALRVAVVGATGAVGQEMRRLLVARDVPLDGEPVFLASERSAGKRLPWLDGEVEVQAISEDAFDGVDVALFSAGGPGRSSGRRSPPPAARSWSTTPRRSGWTTRCRWWSAR
jgi:uncharacterized protein YbjT (DUF2867 family)